MFVLGFVLAKDEGLLTVRHNMLF
ncbi:MAG: hypothetical protein ACREC6_03000 [Hyphomicrobiaceae bacterium]